MGRYSQNREGMVGANTYQPLPVEAFAKNAQNLQDRYDKANLIESQKLDEIGKLARIDENKYKENLTAFQEKLKRTAEENDFDLGRGLNQIVNVIGTEATNPYYNLNRHHVEQAQIKDKLTAQFGSDAIVRNDPYSKSLINPATGQYRSFSELNADVVKRDDYADIARKLTDKLNPVMSEIETQLHRSNIPMYYESKTTGKKELTKEAIRVFADRPEVIKAMQQDAQTMGYDKDVFNVNGKTFDEVFKSGNQNEKDAATKQISDFIFAHSIHQEQHGDTVKYDYKVDELGKLYTQQQHAQANIALEAKLRNANIPAIPITMEGVNVAPESLQKNKENANGLRTNINTLKQANTTLVNGSSTEVFGTKGLEDGLKEFMSGNYAYSPDWIKGQAKRLGLDPDKTLMKAQELKAQYNGNNQQLYTADSKLENYNGYINDVTNKTLAITKNGKEYNDKLTSNFNSIKENNALLFGKLENLGIKTAEDYKKFIEDNSTNQIVPAITDLKVPNPNAKIGFKTGYWGSMEYTAQDKAWLQNEVQKAIDLKQDLVNNAVKNGEIKSSATEVWTGVNEKSGLGLTNKQAETALNDIGSQSIGTFVTTDGRSVKEMLANSKDENYAKFDPNKKVEFKVAGATLDGKGNPIINLVAYQGTDKVGAIPNVDLKASGQQGLVTAYREGIIQELDNSRNAFANNLTSPYLVRKMEKMYGKGMVSEDFHRRINDLPSGESFKFTDNSPYSREFKIEKVGKSFVPYVKTEKNGIEKWIKATNEFSGDAGEVERVIGSLTSQWDTNQQWAQSTDNGKLEDLVLETKNGNLVFKK